MNSLLNIIVKWAYCVTWKGMTPNALPREENQLNDVQAIVVGDADHRKMVVFYIYQDRAMTWDLVLPPSNYEFYPARVGLALTGVNAFYEEYQYSGLRTVSDTPKFSPSVILGISPVWSISSLLCRCKLACLFSAGRNPVGFLFTRI